MRLAVIVLGLVVAAGCSAPDPGEVTYGPRRGAGEANGGAAGRPGGAPASAQGATKPDAGAPSPAAGTPAGDAGGTTADESPNAFTGATPFAAGAATDQSTSHHSGVSHAGNNCMTCHNGTGTKKFLFAGTIYKDQNGTQPAVGVEVRVVSPGAQPFSAFSDNSGNFWVPSQDTVPANSLTGARNSATPRVMATPLASGACNTCHAKGGSTLPLHI